MLAKNITEEKSFYKPLDKILLVCVCACVRWNLRLLKRIKLS